MPVYELVDFTSSIEMYFFTMKFIVNNQEKSERNSAVHSINTGNKFHFHEQYANCKVVRNVRTMLASSYSVVYLANPQV
jgi:hypothetical protein